MTFGTAGCVADCPSTYPYSVAGADSEGMCYQTKTKCACIQDDERCDSMYPNNYSCTYQSSISSAGKFTGVVYLADPDNCVPAPDAEEGYGYCNITKVLCPKNSINNGMYFEGTLESGSCE